MTEDVYQTAKVAKVLLLLNAGKGSELKGKSLAEVEVTAEEVIEYDEKDVEGQDETRRGALTQPETSSKLLQSTNDEILQNTDNESLIDVEFRSRKIVSPVSQSKKSPDFSGSLCAKLPKGRK